MSRNGADKQPPRGEDGEMQGKDVLTPPGSASSPPRPKPSKPLPPDLSGQQLDDFRLVQRLGVGGMGEVYVADQLSLKRRVAVKLLRTDLAVDETYVKRLKSEALSAAQLSHPNIVQIFAVGRADGHDYIAMELVEGPTLKEVMHRKGPLEVSVVLNILRQMAMALSEAGDQGIVHRDIKPENVLLTSKGLVKVADFGLSRQLDEDDTSHITQTGIVVGTPHYMSPEQIQDEELDPRSDIYALGVMAYHMLSGQTPFQGSSAVAIAMQHVQGKAEPLDKLRPDLPRSLCRLVMKMMSRDREKRHPSAHDVLDAVRAVRAEVSESTQSLSLSRTTASTAVFGRRVGGWPWWAWIATGAASVLLLLVIALLFWPRGEAAPAVEPTEVEWRGVKRADRAFAQLRQARRDHTAEAENELLAVEHFWPEATEEVALSLVRLTQIYIRRRDHAKVEQTCDRLLKEFEQAWARAAGLLGKGRLLVAKQKHAEAKELLSKIKPSEFRDRDLERDWYVMMRNCCHELGDTEEARRYDRKLKSLRPNWRGGGSGTRRPRVRRSDSGNTSTD